jgi:hypothetical protein
MLDGFLLKDYPPHAAIVKPGEGSPGKPGDPSLFSVYYLAMYRQRIAELEAKERGDVGLEGEEAHELDRLRSERMQARYDSIPRPPCCPEASKYPAVVFRVDEEQFTLDPNCGGKWRVTLPKELLELYWEPHYYESRPEVKFCPYCGTPLPKMVLKSPVPDTIAQVREGSGYCDRCGERCMCCLCDLPESAYEPEKT